MKINFGAMKTKAIGKIMGGTLVGMTAVMGLSPITAFAGGVEQECTCEKKCTEDAINEDCPVCIYDWKCCEGEESETEEEENWGPLTPDGNMNLVDDYGSLEAGGKQFITVTSKNGNYFYIIIDRDDQGEETVHFLNLVDEADLLALMEDEEVEEYLESKGLVETEDDTETEEAEPETEEPETEESEAEEDVDTGEEAEKETNVTGIMAIILILAIGGIGGYLYFKSKKNKPNKPNGPDPDADYEEDEFEFDEGDDYDLAGDDSEEEADTSDDEIESGSDDESEDD